MIRRHYYGWYADGAFHLSALPADAPVRPNARMETVHEVQALLNRRGVTIDWWPPLPQHLALQLRSGVRMEAE